MTNKKAALHVRVWGRVQGVGFRAFVTQQAKMLGVYGWVRNVGRDQVELRAEGHEDVLKAFLEIVKKGPSVARVDRDEVEWGEFKGQFETFQARWL